MIRTVLSPFGPRLAATCCLILLAGCGGSDVPRELGVLHLDDLSELQDQRENVLFDASTSHDGNGSVLVESTGTEVLRIAAWDTPDFAGDAVEVSGHLKLEMLYRNVWVDVWVDPVDGDPRLIRKVLPEFRRTMDWAPFSVEMHLKPGEKPERIRLALYIEGPGRVWLDDITARMVRLGDGEN